MSDEKQYGLLNSQLSINYDIFIEIIARNFILLIEMSEHDLRLIYLKKNGISSAGTRR